MSMTLVAVFAALVLGHIAPVQVARLRRFHGYAAGLRWLGERFPETGLWQQRYGLLVALVPVLLLVALLQWGLSKPVYGLLELLFSILVLVYAWGPRDLDVDVDAILQAEDPAARQQAVAHVYPPGEVGADQGPALVEAVFSSALRRWFAVLFWFLCLGPVGALLYRLLALAAAGELRHLLPPSNAQGAQRVLTALEWPVAQVMTLAMALMGNFDVVVRAWREAQGNRLQLRTAFLGAAARASVRSELEAEAEDYAGQEEPPPLRELPELRDAMSLVWRILLVWMAVLAVFVIGGWVS